MKRMACALIALSTLFVAAHSLAQDRTEDLTVYLRRVGPFQIGMPLSQVRVILGEPDSYLIQALRQNAQLPREPDNSPCAYLVSTKLPRGIDLMFLSGRLERIDIHDTTIATASRAKIGDTQSRIRDIYGERIIVKPHRYAPDGTYMIFMPRDAADSEYLMLFETNGSVVTEYRVGMKGAVEFPEGCA